MAGGPLLGIWKYRGFILGSVKREFQSRYRNSLLGAAWTILNPLSMIAVYTVIFSQVMQSRLPGIDNRFGYSIYLCAGVITWGLFSEITLRSQSVFLENANLIKKLNFPRICLPMVVVLSAGLNFAIIFGIFLLFLLGTGNFPGLVIFGIIPVLVILLFFSVGLGIVLGVLNVFFRDVGQFFNILLQFWFWFTPIVYPLSIIPERMRPLLTLNPMAAVVTACQAIFVNASLPAWRTLAPIAILAVFLCLWGMSLYRRHSGEMVDEL
jgi:lipopolysaccharide transport system permease protein